MYRTGAVGALLDIYEKAICELKNVIKDIADEDLLAISDAKTQDENCRSIQSILSHVVHSGYGYATSICNLGGGTMVRPSKTFYPGITGYLKELSNVFAYTEDILKDTKDDELEQLDDSLKIKTGWGQLYDAEQMMEHAIVHILRHTIQIEKIKIARQH
jgi:hypothetical protein